MPDEQRTSLPDHSTAEPRFDLLAPRWEFDCLECEVFDTYGYEDVRQLALEHVRKTGHTLSVARRESGWLRPAPDETLAPNVIDAGSGAGPQGGHNHETPEEGR